MPSNTSSWGRGPLVVAGIAMACLLASLTALFYGAVSDELLTGAILAALLVLAALLALAVQSVVLVRDRFPRHVLGRLDAIEARLESAPQEVTTTIQAQAPDEGPPERPAEAPAPPAQPAVPQPMPGPTPEVTSVASAGTTSGARRAQPTLSWEMLLGGRALAVVGGVVLLVAVGLFLKFGWDQGWFRPSPATRVALGVVAGFALLAVGEIARRGERFAVLSQALTAVGIGTVYVSAWAAHGLYGLVSAGPALLLLAAAAAAGVILATATDGRAIASLSAVGGLLAPVVVDLPPQPPTMLYVYLLVVLAAAAAVSVGRRWPELGPIATAGVAIHVAISFEWRWEADVGRLVDAGFLLSAVVLLIAVSLGFAWRRRSAPGRVELAVLAAASLAGWGAGLARLEPLGTIVGGAWTLSILLIELGAAQILLARLGEDARGRKLFLALAGVFLVALPPVVWDGAWVAAAWALEALAVAFAGSGPIAGRAGAVVAVMAAGAAVVARDGPAPAAPFANREWFLLTAATVFLAALLAVVEQRRGAGRDISRLLSWAAAPSAVVAVFAWFAPEIEAWSRTAIAPRPAHGILAIAVAVVMAVVAAALFAAWQHRTATATWLSGIGAAAVALLWPGSLSGLDRWQASAAALPLLTVAAAAAAATVRRSDPRIRRGSWTAAGLGIGIAVLAATVRLRIGWPGDDLFAGGIVPAAAAGGGAVLLLTGSFRLPTGAARAWLESAGWATAVAAASRALTSAFALAPAVTDVSSERAGIVAMSVLWGGAGLALVLAGLAGSVPHRRHLGLALLAATVLKVFLVDLAAAPTVLRIVAFLVTGLALLAGAWLYARYRERLEPAA